MKVSRAWLQREFFKEKLPSAYELAEALTFHAFEIEEVQGDSLINGSVLTEGDLLDVKVLPNRAADCLSHRGIARELAAILSLPFSRDPLRAPLSERPDEHPSLKVTIEDPKECDRYSCALVRGVRIGPSPAWLREALESVGQRSINNVVDATNYVMLNIGQPLHAFDARSLTSKDGRYQIGVRGAKAGEVITTLSDDTYTLPPGTLLITDALANTPIGIAGIKGGKAAEVTSDTTDLIIEAAHFDGTLIRRAAQALKLFTDASIRFQNRPSPELVGYGMRDVLVLITGIAGGEVVGVTDVSAARPGAAPVGVSLARINSLLGSSYTTAEVESAFARLGLPCTTQADTFTVTPPFERTDLLIPEDLIEEVGRLMGYDQIPAVELPPLAEAPDQARYRGIERMKDELVAKGFIEVSTQSFAREGEVVLANPLDIEKPALRTSLEDNLSEALTKAKYVAPLVLAPKQKPKLFEVGTVFPKEGECIELRMTEPAWPEVPTHDNLSVAKLEDYGKDYEPKSHPLSAFTPFSAYPFITRDIAFWAPSGSDEARTQSLIRENAGELCTRVDLFDRFEKEGRTSFGYRLVFQSTERTLTDEEVNTLMEPIIEALTEQGFEVR